MVVNLTGIDKIDKRKTGFFTGMDRICRIKERKKDF